MERPCIIVDEIEGGYLVIKVTRAAPRKYDEYDTSIEYWKECGLTSPSTARVSKLVTIKDSQIDNFKGKLNPEDEKNIANLLEKFIE